MTKEQLQTIRDKVSNSVHWEYITLSARNTADAMPNFVEVADEVTFREWQRLRTKAMVVTVLDCLLGEWDQC